MAEEIKGEYRVIFQDPYNNLKWDFWDLDTLEEAENWVKHIKLKNAQAHVHIKEYVVVTGASQTPYFTEREAKAEKERINAEHPEIFEYANVTTRNCPTCPTNILYG